MKFRHILFLLAAVLTIAFMQPLVSFVGGLTLLVGVGALIFRDLSPPDQDAVERRVLGWLRRVRAKPALKAEPPPVRRRYPALSTHPDDQAQRPRRVRAKIAHPADNPPLEVASPSPLSDEATADLPPRREPPRSNS